MVSAVYFSNLCVTVCSISKPFFLFVCLAGHHFLHRDEGSDTLKADTIESAFKELHSEVDAVFSYDSHLYMIKVNVKRESSYTSY